jgi:metallo-beta-lactamase class B
MTPFQIGDNLYYVGSKDLAAYLVTTPAGDILINANLESSPPQIRAAVEELGFKYTDIKILLNGQAHYDHMAGAAEVLRETGAKDMVMDGDVEVVQTGGKADFSYKTDGILTFPKARVDRVLHDGDTVQLGGVVLTARRTPGHTRGCTTWTMRTHVPGEPAGQMRDVVIVGGMSALSQYSLTGKPTKAHPAWYPGIEKDFPETFAKLRALPCDVFLGAHGLYFGMLVKVDRMAKEGPEVFVDPAGYKKAVDDAEASFEKAVAKQKTAGKG